MNRNYSGAHPQHVRAGERYIRQFSMFNSEPVAILQTRGRDTAYKKSLIYSGIMAVCRSLRNTTVLVRGFSPQSVIDCFRICFSTYPDTGQNFLYSYLHIEEKSSEAVMLRLREHSALFCVLISLKRRVRAARQTPTIGIHKYNRMRALCGLFRPVHHIPGERGAGGLPEDAAPSSPAYRGCSRPQANIS
jgi:hypothetical protein